MTDGSIVPLIGQTKGTALVRLNKIFSPSQIDTTNIQITFQAPLKFTLSSPKLSYLTHDRIPN